MFKNFWYAVEFSAAIANQPKLVKVFDQDFVLYRTTDGSAIAMSNICVHRGGSLADGRVEKDCIVCPYHGWHYQADGTCVKIPANSPNTVIPQQAKIKTYPVQEKYGWIWLFLGDFGASEKLSIPEMPDFRSDRNLSAIQGEFHWNANYERVIENGLDFAHAPFVHAGAFGNPDAPQIDKLDIENYEWGASATVMLQPTPPRGLWQFLAKSEPAKVKTRTGFLMPNLTFLEVTLPFGKLVIYTAHVPIDSHTTVSKWINLRSFFRGKWADSDAYKRTIKIFQQDQPIVEAQRPQIIPYALNAEVHVQADALQLEYRKLRRQAHDMG